MLNSLADVFVLLEIEGVSCSGARLTLSVSNDTVSLFFLFSEEKDGCMCKCVDNSDKRGVVFCRLCLLWMYA